MEFDEWIKYSEADQKRLCQQLVPQQEWQLFKAIETAFISKYANQEGVGTIFCGLTSGLGPANAITVSIIRGRPRSKLPRYFLGFPVLRRYERSKQVKPPDIGSSGHLHSSR